MKIKPLSAFIFETLGRNGISTKSRSLENLGNLKIVMYVNEELFHEHMTIISKCCFNFIDIYMIHEM